MTIALERLEALLDERDEQVAELKRKVSSLEHELNGEHHGWTRHYKGNDDASLPMPRLEMEWAPSDKKRGWGEHVIEYRLVYMHLVEGCISIPLGRTKSSTSNNMSPYEEKGRNGVPFLPYRDGAHAHHDAALFGLPLYVITPKGPVRIDGDDDYDHQRKVGLDHRRALP